MSFVLCGIAMAVAVCCQLGCPVRAEAIKVQAAPWWLLPYGLFPSSAMFPCNVTSFSCCPDLRTFLCMQMMIKDCIAQSQFSVPGWSSREGRPRQTEVTAWTVRKLLSSGVVTRDPCACNAWCHPTAPRQPSAHLLPSTALLART